MDTIDTELKEYALAFQLHLKAQREEMRNKLEVKATYYRLIQAKQALESKGKLLLEEVERNQHENI